MEDITADVLQTVNDASSDTLRSHGQAVLAKLLGGASKAAGNVTDVLVADALAVIYAVALRKGWTEAVLQDWLTSAAFKSEKAQLLVAIYADGTAKGQRQAPTDEATLRDGFLPRVVGVDWQASHQLGDRLVRPPQRSTAQFAFNFKTTGGKKDDVAMQLSAEQAQDLLAVLKDMVKEAERVTRQGQ